MQREPYLISRYSLTWRQERKHNLWQVLVARLIIQFSGRIQIIFTPDSEGAHKSLPLRNARTYCEGHETIFRAESYIQRREVLVMGIRDKGS